MGGWLGEGSVRTDNTDKWLPVGKPCAKFTAGRQLRGTEPIAGLEGEEGA